MFFFFSFTIYFVVIEHTGSLRNNGVLNQLMFHISFHNLFAPNQYHRVLDPELIPLTA